MSDQNIHEELENENIQENVQETENTVEQPQEETSGKSELDIILIDNDSLFIIFNKNAQLSEIRKNDKKLGLKIIPKNYHIYYTGKRHY